MSNFATFRNFFPVNDGNKRGYVDVVLDGKIVIRGFKILETTDDNGKPRLWVAAPSRPQKDKKTGKTDWLDIVYCPKESGYWKQLSNEIIEYYKEQISATPTL